MSTFRREDANPTGFLRYCLDEALTSLRRRWRVAVLSTLLLAAAVLVVGAALGVSAALRDVSARMTQAAELSVYLARDASLAQRNAAADLTRRDGAVASSWTMRRQRPASWPTSRTWPASSTRSPNGRSAP